MRTHKTFGKRSTADDRYIEPKARYFLTFIEKRVISQ